VFSKLVSFFSYLRSSVSATYFFPMWVDLSCLYFFPYLLTIRFHFCAHLFFIHIFFHIWLLCFHLSFDLVRVCVFWSYSHPISNFGAHLRSIEVLVFAFGLVGSSFLSLRACFFVG
jgi:hypothetical protein